MKYEESQLGRLGETYSAPIKKADCPFRRISVGIGQTFFICNEPETIVFICDEFESKINISVGHWYCHTEYKPDSNGDLLLFLKILRIG